MYLVSHPAIVCRKNVVPIKKFNHRKISSKDCNPCCFQQKDRVMVYSEMSTDGSTGPFSLIMPHTRDMQGVRTGFKDRVRCIVIYEGWNFNSDNYLFTTDTK